MPRYVLSRKVRSLSGAFDISDEHGGECYRVRGKLLSAADKLSLQDTSGRELALIQQRVGLHGLRYEIARSGEVAARVTATAPVRQQMTVETPDGAQVAVTGDILGRKYELARDGSVIAAVSTRWALGGGSFGADIADGEDQVLLLAVVVAIEMIHRHETG
ncbi:MAG TPA: LURP-one-related family protein [Streptosporangiaceae bacterium]|nr:LURP-one-related family protein [Streptosporangiaceae bacterium]